MVLPSEQFTKKVLTHDFFAYSQDLNINLNNKLLLTRYSEALYSNGGMNTGLNSVQYSNGILIMDHTAIGQL